jgi:parallel beta-helix repeat protein
LHGNHVASVRYRSSRKILLDWKSEPVSIRFYAISITADDVILDLNGYTMSGTGPGSQTEGISAPLANQNSITIRNGTLKGFTGAIDLGGDSNVVENMRVLDCFAEGIALSGSSNTVRNNQITNTNRSLNINGAIGIVIADGHNNAVLNNGVSDTGVGGGSLGATGIQVELSDRTIVENNRIEHLVGPTSVYATQGIYFFMSNNGLAVNNRIVRSSGAGIAYAQSTGVFRDNIAVACATPYFGGTNGGNNQ